MIVFIVILHGQNMFVNSAYHLYKSGNSEHTMSLNVTSVLM